mmetsp:Transcript_12075/g.19048  ORF Transcript_12075/g.19048 Transcript_12075/m.19048 type:complete len:350 (+) Transcript_12075:131-1180(+)
MSQNASTSVAQLLERLVEENREQQVRQSQGQPAFTNILSPLGEMTRLLNLSNNSSFDSHVASPGLGGLQSAAGGANSELERAIVVLTQELLRQQAEERARQALQQQSQKDLAQHCIASLLLAAQLQQQQDHVATQPLAAAPSSGAVTPRMDESRKEAAEARPPKVASQITELPTQVDTKKRVPLKKRPAKKTDAPKPAKKKSSYKKSGVKKQAKIEEEEPDSLSYPCRCRGLPENHNAKTAFIAIPNGVAHGQALRCSHPICRSRGVRFRYCSTCRRPVAKRNFSTRHNHPEASVAEAPQVEECTNGAEDANSAPMTIVQAPSSEAMDETPLKNNEENPLEGTKQEEEK